MYEELEDLLHPSECKDLITLCESSLQPKQTEYITGHTLVDGQLKLQGGFDENIVKATHFELPNDHPLVARAWAIGSNWAQHNNYSIDTHTGILVSKYEVGGHYGWHVDGFGKNDRLSAVVQLSDPNDYEGCELQFGEDLTGANRTIGRDIFHDWDLTQRSVKPVHTLSKKIGAGCIFDSFIYHRVTPLIKGTRYTLLTWFREYNDNTENT